MGARLFWTQSLGFSKIFLFAKDLRFKSFGNTWDNIHIQFLLIIILFRLTCGEENYVSNKEYLKFRQSQSVDSL